MRKLFAALTALATAGIVPVAMAATLPYTLFGEASFEANAVTLVSDNANALPYGGVDFDVPSGTTFADLASLAVDYNVTDDDCKGGSPRFSINVDTGAGIKNIFAYVGPEPSYVGCTPETWESSGNLLDGVRKLDTGQLAGGTFYDTYAHALSTYGAYPVTGIQLVIDSSWAFGDGEQTVLVDNVDINGNVSTFTGVPTDKAECKNGGWMNVETTTFANQGQCVSAVVSKGKNK